MTHKIGESVDRRSALVTGASRGIGRDVARSLARKGYCLTITARSIDVLEQVADELQDLGSPQVVPVAGDIADHECLAMIVGAHHEHFGDMRALIVNAGVGTAGPIGEVPMERAQKTVQVNLLSSLELIQGALPLLRAHAERNAAGARVVVLSSISGVYAEPGLAAYGASKAGVISLVETLNAEESRHGISATAIAPGYVDTDMSDWIKDSIPAAAMIQIEDIVRIVDTVLALGRTAVINRVVVTRAGTVGYSA